MGDAAATKLLKFWGVKYLPAGEPPQDVSDKAERLAQLKAEAASCEKCPLAGSRNASVFGEGDPNADVVFVGEAPGFEEDKQGRPFVGRAGQLLNDIITKGMALRREDVYICNVLKCRPPENRTPSPEEIVACCACLFEQLRIIRPKVIIALGAPAAKTLLDTTRSISQLRGQFHDFYIDEPPTGEPIKLMPTFHPAYLLRNPSAKMKVWEDIKKVLNALGLPIPGEKQ